jgi:spermidine synthase
VLLGGFRAVFSLLLTVILVGIGVGSLLCAVIDRHTARPAYWLIGVQGLFVAFTRLGLATVDVGSVDRPVGAGAGSVAAPAGPAQVLAELWFNARPMLLEVAVPALLMGFSFPLANAITQTQRAERLVGRRAGVLYLSNTLGAVCGSLAVGFVFLPLLGIQGSVTLLSTVAGLAVVPLYVAARTSSPAPRMAFASVAVGGGALVLWLFLPTDDVITRAMLPPAPNERLVSLREASPR